MPVMPTSRAGLTLAELLVAMTILGVIGTAAAGAIRMQAAAHARVTARVAAAAQLREAAAPLVADLMLASTAGDLIHGSLSDTALALHATVAFGHACALTSGDEVSLHALLLRSRGRQPAAGDTVRMYGDGGRWHAGRVVAVTRSTSSDSGCQPGNDEESVKLEVDPEVRDSIAVGAVLRVTRPQRYSFYRAGDGHLYIGLREWSHATNALAGVQPVAGPFVQRDTRFRYFDSTIAELRGPAIAPRRIAAVGVVFATLSPHGLRQDSLLVPLRNR